MSLPGSIQDLPRDLARLCLGINRFTRDTLGADMAGASIVAAVSGGSDSLALLLVLHYLRSINHNRIICTHINHGLRPEANDEERLVSDLCHDLGIILESTKIDVSGYAAAKGMGIEEAGRFLRYNFLEEVRIKTDSEYLVTAHHLNDLAEDVLMRLTRGTGWPALSGMTGNDFQRHLVRPLLLTTKEELRNFPSKLGIAWCEDSSNSDQTYFRNRVRYAMLPMFLKENPHFLESVARLWKQGQLDHDHFDLELDKVTKHVDSNEIMLERKDLESVHQAVRLRIYRDILRDMGPGQVLSDTIFSLDEAFIQKRTNRSFQFPGRKNATLKKNGIFFTCSNR